MSLEDGSACTQAEAEVRDARGTAEEAAAARDRALSAKTVAEAALASAQQQALAMRAQIRKVWWHPCSVSVMQQCRRPRRKLRPA